MSELPLPYPLTNLEKVLYPEIGLRKGDVLAYYAVVAECMLPDLAGRAADARAPPRRPRAQACFFQKHATAGVPKVVARVPIEEETGKREPYMAVRRPRGPPRAARSSARSRSTRGVAHADEVERPDLLVFDLDPDVGLDWERKSTPRATSARRSATTASRAS